MGFLFSSKWVYIAGSYLILIIGIISLFFFVINQANKLTACMLKNTSLINVIKNMENVHAIETSLDDLSDAAVIRRLCLEYCSGCECGN